MERNSVQIGKFKMNTEAEITLLSQIKNKVKRRSFHEAVEYLEKCKCCPQFRETHCSLAAGARDPLEKFLNTLSTGYCKEWEKPAKGSLAYRFITTANLLTDTSKLLAQVPPDIDLVIGVARSGLLPATYLACQLHRPLASLSKRGLTACGDGWRLQSREVPHTRKILLVDDTVYSGSTLAKMKLKIAELLPGVEVLTAAIYVHPKSVSKLDYHSVMLPGRHYLEWNFFNSIGVSRAVFDFDGILCEDIKAIDDDDGERYIKALENAIPKYYVRREPIPVIATARLEKYRDVTVDWLNRHEIRFKKLVMGPWKTQNERRKQISKFKADVYSAYEYNLFVESEPGQAREIAALTKKEVLCPRLGRVLNV